MFYASIKSCEYIFDKHKFDIKQKEDLENSLYIITKFEGN
jgi:hypothetical protein